MDHLPSGTVVTAAPTVAGGPARWVSPARGAPRAASVAKELLRQRMRSSRRARTIDEQVRLGLALADIVLAAAEVRGVHTVTCYLSVPGEPSTFALRRSLADAGVRVLLPVMRRDRDLDWVLDAPPRAQHGPSDRPGDGVLLPVPRLNGAPRPPGRLLGRRMVAQADLVLAPALAVDTLGNRLGHGGGSFDRALRRVPPAVPVMALVHDDELLDAAVEAVPTEPHDVRISLAATPTRCLILQCDLQC